MKAEDVYVGMLVQIRTLKDIGAEYGFDGTGDAQCPSVFIKEMGVFSGDIVRVTACSHRSGAINFDPVGPQSSYRLYTWNAAMVNPYIETGALSLITMPRLSLLEQLENAPEHLYKHILEIS